MKTKIMKFFKELKYYWMIFKDTTIWYRNSNTGKEWDHTLRLLLEDIKEIKLDSFNMYLNGYEIWIANWPYAYGYCWDESRDDLPSRVTALKLREVEKICKKYGVSYYNDRKGMNRNGSNQC